MKIEQRAGLQKQGDVTHLEHPLILSELGVEGSLLEALEPQGEAGAYFLDVNTLRIPELVPAPLSHKCCCVLPSWHTGPT